jgi:hypothetical protein
MLGTESLHHLALHCNEENSFLLYSNINITSALVLKIAQYESISRLSFAGAIGILAHNEGDPSSSVEDSTLSEFEKVTFCTVYQTGK